MKVGTPGFVGDRLREAREARGLTAASLADLVGIPRQSISAYEKGDATPQPQTAERIADRLSLPIAFFLDPRAMEDPSTIYWRSLAAATKTARTRSRRRLDWLRQIVEHITQFVELPELRLPPALVVDDPVEISEEMIEDAATRARQFFGLGDGAIENVTWLLENHGIIVAFAHLEAATLDAFSQITRDGRAFAVVNGDHGTSVRYRFDLAHELAHLVLHRNIRSERFSPGPRSAEMERQAHAFAGYFLMPARAFAKNFYGGSVESLKLTKRMWGVSMQAGLYHADRLRLVSPTEAQKLWRALSVRGWRRHEPFDDVIQREEPQLLRSAFESMLAGGLSPAAILDPLPYSAREIESLCNLTPGTLAPSESPTDIAYRAYAQDVRRKDRQVSADVVPFSVGRRDR